MYVSDAPGKHDFDVLRQLVFPSGAVLRANLPGRPTRDCLFTDVTRDGVTALKAGSRRIVYRYSPHHPLHSVPVLATQSATKCTGARHVII